MPKQEAIDFLEERRLKGIAVTGRELRGRYSRAEHEEGIRKQRKKLKPVKPGSDEEIMESQSKMRKMFNKGY